MLCVTDHQLQPASRTVILKSGADERWLLQYGQGFRGVTGDYGVDEGRSWWWVASAHDHMILDVSAV